MDIVTPVLAAFVEGQRCGFIYMLYNIFSDGLGEFFSVLAVYEWNEIYMPEIIFK